MPVGRHTQTSFAAGEFDPLLWSREDVSFFYNSAQIIENAIPLPQGGVKRREGWRYRALQRGPISEISLAGATVTAVNGGTVANLFDGNQTTLFTTTTAIGTTLKYEVVRIQMPSATRVSLIDCDLFRLTSLPSGTDSVTLMWQTSPDGTTWTDTASIKVGTNTHNRRFAYAPDTDIGNDIYWRLIVDNPGAVDLGAAVVEMSELRCYSEAGFSIGPKAGNFSLHRLTAEVEAEYILVMTAGNVDVFSGSNGVWVGAAAVPHTDAQVQFVKSNPRLDSMFFYHEDQPPFFVQKVGNTAIEWRSAEIEFEDVVAFPFEDDNVSGGENEIQHVQFANMVVGDRVAVEFNGNISTSFVYTATIATNTANLKTAIEELDDITSVTVTHEDGGAANTGYLVEFVGVDGKRAWATLVVDIQFSTGGGTVVISRRQYGKPDTDDLWSATRGYPRCGAFYQGRHWMGGLKARPDVIVASRAGGLFEFKEDADPVASSPIVVAPNVDDEVTIHNIYAGRHLQIFTSSAELYVPDEPITVDNIALKTTSRHGANEMTKPVDIQGGTLFIDRNGQALREYLFVDAEQSYSAEPVSLLAGHLVASPSSMAMRRAQFEDEPTLLLLSNTGLDREGKRVPPAICVIDRAQQVTAFVRIATEGTVNGFATTQAGQSFVMVERSLAVRDWNFLEQFDGAAMSDASISVSGSGSTITGLSAYPWLEGETVYVHGDGLPLGEFTVTGGQIDLGDFSFASEAEVGLRQVPRIVLHPFKGRGETSPTMQNMRIFRALLHMIDTAGIAVASRSGQAARPVPLQNYDSGTFDPTIDELKFTGVKRLSGLGGWEKEPNLTITQVEPLPFLLRSVTYDVRY